MSLAVVKGMVEVENREQKKRAWQIAKDALFARRVADELAMGELLAKRPLHIKGGQACTPALTEFPTLAEGALVKV